MPSAADMSALLAHDWRRLQAAKAEGLVDDIPRETDETAPAHQVRETVKQ